MSAQVTSTKTVPKEGQTHSYPSLYLMSFLPGSCILGRRPVLFIWRAGAGISSKAVPEVKSINIVVCGQWR
jgi:hypothetical protein